ncbi:aromatase/cyclase [Dactylosporangium sp. CA-139066]|uniref:aromatase/cyclase n=1 Tax=Dactylosporangium sp. CA-139066 TaxID=3239930 RepID=UPI003D946A11
MHDNGHRQVEHTIDVGAPAAEVYRLIADVRHWPRIFPPTVYAEQVERADRSERIRIWATANGAVKHWTSRRELDPDGLRVDFRQEVSAAPVAAMGGAWVIEPAGAATARIRLLHDYRAIDDDPADLAWIDEAVDRNSKAELAALKANVERAVGAGEELVFSFTDSVDIDGAAKDVYEFLDQAQHWQHRLPHVSRVVLTEDTPGVQTLEMVTVTKDGAAHTTKSIRVCFPHHRIVYKQTTLPALMSLHTGCWDITEHESGVTASSEHTVVLNPATITAVLGPEAGIGEARAFVRTALSTNSTATLGLAKDYAESLRR